VLQCADLSGKKKQSMKKVTIYSTPTCHYCNLAKDFFKEKNVQYETFDVAADLEKRKEMIERSGQMGVPVIFIDNEMIVGFDQPKIASLLGL
jgi:glutaredoxin-like YruB-family protein